MEFPKVICLTRDRGFARQAHQAIGLSCARLTIVTDLTELSEKQINRADLVLLDARLLEEEPQVVLDEEPVLAAVRDGALVLVNPTQLETCITALVKRSCDIITSGDLLFNNVEILTTIRKFGSSDIFDLRKYMPWGGYCYESKVASFIDKRNVVSWVAAAAHRVGCARWLTVELEILTDELLSKAIYAEDDVNLQGSPVSSALLRWACTDGCIHVSVCDKRGSFHKGMLVDALCALASESGDELAQLGLPRLITLAQRLVVNVVPGWSAETILSVPLRGRKTAVPSLSFFSTAEAPDEAATSTGPVTISANGRLMIETIGLEASVSIRAINALSAEVTIQEPLEQPIYPGTNFTLAVIVPFHGEFKVSGLVFRVLDEQPVTLSLSFATGYKEWERVVGSMLVGEK
jgi:hypothetical protein